MTNKCDLDEMKHIAQQKFIELVESGVEWRRGMPYANTARPVEGPEFCVRFPSFYAIGDYSLSLGKIPLWSRDAPEEREPRTNKNGTPNKADQKAAEKELAGAIAELDADPFVVAIKGIRKQIEDREGRLRLVERQKAQEASCKALQEALKNTATTLAPSTYKEHTEAPVQSEGLLGKLLRRMGL